MDNVLLNMEDSREEITVLNVSIHIAKQHIIAAHHCCRAVLQKPINIRITQKDRRT